MSETVFQGTKEQEILAPSLRRVLASMDIQAIWTAATLDERRQLFDELLEGLTVYPEHIEVKILGTPVLKVALYEVQRPRREENACVEGPTSPISPAARLMQWT